MPTAWPLIGPEIKNDAFYNMIISTLKSRQVSAVLEIGASSGDGSTEALLKGISEQPAARLYSIEACRERFAVLEQRYRGHPQIVPSNTCSISLDAFPSEQDVVNFYNTVPCKLQQNALDRVLGWLRADRDYVIDNAIPQNGIAQIREQHGISHFDAVLIDGSEFLGSAELELLYGADVVFLDDIDGFKNWHSHQRLKHDPRYQCLAEDHSLRAGFSVFVRSAAVDLLETHNIASRAWLAMCDVHSKWPVSSVRRLQDYASFDYEPGGTIYVCNSAIGHFVQTRLGLLDKPFVLMSGDSDDTMPSDLPPQLYAHLVDSPLLLHWYCQNWIGQHPKVSQLPIGLDYHTLSAGHATWGLAMLPSRQEALLAKLAREHGHFSTRQLKCYANFQFQMNTRYAQDRRDAIAQVSSDLVDYEPTRVPCVEAWQHEARYAFVLSPHGNGLDCHRTWEALLMGCIPIVKQSPLDPLYVDLPVLIVSSWSDVTAQRLAECIAQFGSMSFDMGKLQRPHWQAKIAQHRVSLASA